MLILGINTSPELTSRASEGPSSHLRGFFMLMASCERPLPGRERGVQQLGCQDACVLVPAAVTGSPCDLAEVTATLSLQGKTEGAKLAFSQGMRILEDGVLPAPHEPQPRLVLLIWMKKCFCLNSGDFGGTPKARSKELLPQQDVWPLAHAAS